MWPTAEKLWDPCTRIRPPNFEPTPTTGCPTQSNYSSSTIIFLFAVAETWNDKGGASQDRLFRHFSHNRDHVRRLVAVRSHWSDYGGNKHRNPALAVLDQTYRRSYRIHGRARVHVRAMQNVHPAVPAVASVQPRHLRSGLPDDGMHPKVPADGATVGKCAQVRGAVRATVGDAPALSIVKRSAISRLLPLAYACWPLAYTSVDPLRMPFSGLRFQARRTTWNFICVPWKKELWYFFIGSLCFEPFESVGWLGVEWKRSFWVGLDLCVIQHFRIKMWYNRFNFTCYQWYSVGPFPGPEVCVRAQIRKIGPPQDWAPTRLGPHKIGPLAMVFVGPYSGPEVCVHAQICKIGPPQDWAPQDWAPCSLSFVRRDWKCEVTLLPDPCAVHVLLFSCE